MQRDYIEIENKSYRVEFNWNTTANFLDKEGLSLGQADDLGKLKAQQVTGLVYEGVCEGCRLDKIDFPYSKDEFGSMLQPGDVRDLLLIYAKHSSSKQLELKKK